MLVDDKNRHFEIIRENIFSDDGRLIYDNYVEEFKPYDVSSNNKKYANFGAIQILEFALKKESISRNRKEDRKFEKHYLRTKEYISNKVFNSPPILESYVSDSLSSGMLTPLLRNLTYGETALCVWIYKEQTYALVNAGRGESICSLLFFCRVEEVN